VSCFSVSEHLFVVVRKLRFPKYPQLEQTTSGEGTAMEQRRKQSYHLSSTPFFLQTRCRFTSISFIYPSSHQSTSRSRRTTPSPILPFPSSHEFRKSLLLLSLSSTDFPLDTLSSPSTSIINHLFSRHLELIPPSSENSAGRSTKPITSFPSPLSLPSSSLN